MKLGFITGSKAVSQFGMEDSAAALIDRRCILDMMGAGNFPGS